MSTKRRLPEGIAERAEQILQEQRRQRRAYSESEPAAAIEQALRERGLRVSPPRIPRGDWEEGMRGTNTWQDQIARILGKLETNKWFQLEPETRPVPQFRPEKPDDLDLAWFFRQGRRPKQLDKRQRNRWNRVNRCLDGRGWRLRLYYTNAHGYHDRLLAARTDEAIRDAVVAAGIETDPLKWLASADRAAANGADTREERILLHRLREVAVLRLNVEYRRYVRNSAYKAFEPYCEFSHAAMLRLFALPSAQRLICQPRIPWRGWWYYVSGSNLLPDQDAYLLDTARTPNESLEALLRLDVLELGTWGGLRIGAENARWLVENLFRDIPLSNIADMRDSEVFELLRTRSKPSAVLVQPATARVPKLLATTDTEDTSSRNLDAATWGALERSAQARSDFQNRVEAGSDLTSEQHQQAREGAPELAFTDDDGANAIGDEQERPHDPHGELAHRDWFDLGPERAHTERPWAKHYSETRVGKKTTTVRELAKTYKPLPSSAVRRLLQQYGCPGADKKRAQLPLDWFRGRDGQRFAGVAADLAAKRARLLKAEKARRR